MDISGISAAKAPPPGRGPASASLADPARHDQSFGDLFAGGGQEQGAPRVERTHPPPRPPAQALARDTDIAANETPAADQTATGSGGTEGAPGADDADPTADSAPTPDSTANDPGPDLKSQGVAAAPAVNVSPDGDTPGGNVGSGNVGGGDVGGGDADLSAGAKPPAGVAASRPSMRAAAPAPAPADGGDVAAAAGKPAAGTPGLSLALGRSPEPAPAQAAARAVIDRPGAFPVAVRSLDPGPEAAGSTAPPDPPLAQSVTAPAVTARAAGPAGTALPAIPASPGSVANPTLRARPQVPTARADAAATPAPEAVPAPDQPSTGLSAGPTTPDPVAPDRAHPAAPRRAGMAVSHGMAGPGAALTPISAPGTEGPAPVPPEIARIVAPQIAAVLPASPGTGQIEIQLDPPELGKVEILFDMTETRLRATVVAERPAVGEMMRRHADILQIQLQQAGFVEIDLHFGRDNPGARWGAPPQPPRSEARPGTPPDTGFSGSPEPGSYRPRHTADGLDLRL